MLVSAAFISHFRWTQLQFWRRGLLGRGLKALLRCDSHENRLAGRVPVGSLRVRATRAKVTVPSVATNGSWQYDRHIEARSSDDPVRRIACLTLVRTMIDHAPVKSASTPPTAKLDFAGRQSHPQVGGVLRRARMHHQLSLREVERRIGRSNAYLSQIERGLIKQPDPIVLLELAELYGLNFRTLATWALWLADDPDPANASTRDSTAILVRQIMELEASERATVLRYVESILRERRT